jgi:hypothetical protein
MSVLYLTTAAFKVPPPVIPGHNGGITQIGVGAPGYQASYETLNIFKMCQGWSTINLNAAGNRDVDPNDLNADGYLTVINNGGVYSVMYIPTTTERPGIISNDYKVTWDGTGTIYCPSGTISSGSVSTSGFTFTPNTNRISIGISAGTNVTNLKVFHVDDEADVLAGKIWGKKFLERLVQLKPGRIRFMDWQTGNFGNCAQWKYRKPLTHACWAAAEPRKAINAGLTANTGDAYSNIGTFTDPYYGSGGPTDKQTIIVRWSATATGNNPTFNLNGTGALPILPPPVFAFTGSTHTGRPGLNRWSGLVFDAGLNSWIAFGSDTGSNYIDNGIPYEAMVDLCATVGAHPHFSTPYLAADPPTDLLSGAATYVRDFGPAWMKGCYEPPNETWNSAFYVTSYADVRQGIRNGVGKTYTNTAVSFTGSGTTGTSTLTFSDNAPPLGARISLGTYSGLSGFNGQDAYVTAVISPLVVTINRAPTAGTSPWTGSTTITPNAGDRHNWYGRATSLLGQSVSAVFSNNRTKYDFVCAVQTTTGFTGSATSAPRIDATGYVFTGGSAAYNWVTSGCTSTYASTSDYAKTQEMVWAYNLFKGGTTQPPLYVDGQGAASAPQNNAYLLACYQNWKTFFSTAPRNINKLTTYEGGYNADYYGTNLIASTNNTTVSSPISGISNAAQCVVTMATTSWPGSITTSGPALDNSCAGFMLAVHGLVAGPTALNCTLGTCTFSGSTVTRTNTFIAGQMVLFTSTGVLPTGTDFAKNLPLWVINPTGTTFQVAATKGGSAIAFTTTGQSGTHSVQSGWAVVSVSGNNVTLDVDTSNTTTYPPYVSGGTITYANARYMLNQLRYQGKLVTSSPGKATGLKGYTKDNINNFLAQTGGGFTAEYPSHYLLSMLSGRPDLTGDIGDGGEWGALEGVYTSLPSPIFDGNAEINAGI